MENVVTLKSPSLWRALNLTNDPDFLELRRKHYGGDDEVLVKGSQPNTPSGYFRHVPWRVGGKFLGHLLNFKIVEPIVGWESSGWTSSEASSTEWQEIFNHLDHEDSWHIFRSLGHSPSEHAQIIAAAQRAGRHVLSHVEPMRVIYGVNSWEHYLSLKKKKARGRYKSTIKAGEKGGFRVTEQMPLTDVVKLYKVRHLDSVREDYTQNAQFYRFLEEFVDRFSTQDRIERCGVYLGDELIAMTLGFWKERVFFLYQTAYHPAYKHSSPGSLAFYKTLERVLNKGADLVSFMGDREYLSLYSDQILHTYRVDIFARSFVGTSLYRLLSRGKSDPHRSSVPVPEIS